MLIIDDEMLFFLIRANWHECNAGILEIKGHPIVAQKIAAENAGLFEAGSFVDQIQIQSDCGYITA